MVLQATPGIPGPARHELRRERLLERLHEHAARPLVLLLAPAGFGKSTVAAGYARESGANVAWLGLHAGDRDAHFFFGRLAAALTAAFAEQRQDDDLLPSLRRGLSEGADGPGLARLLVTDLARAPGGFILVLDDYHAIRDANDIHEAVDILVRGLPEAGQIVITAREPPPLSIHGLVVQDAVFVLGADDLRFTPEETTALRRALGGDASHDLDADGWVAASGRRRPGSGGHSHGARLARAGAGRGAAARDERGAARGRARPRATASGRANRPARGTAFRSRAAPRRRCVGA